MGADSYRKQVEPVLYRLSTVFLRYNPNTLTVISFILALLTAAVLILAGRIFPFYLIIIAFVTLFLSAFLDAMDGFVARRKNISSSYGDMLDHTFDRYSDLAYAGAFYKYVAYIMCCSALRIYFFPQDHLPWESWIQNSCNCAMQGN